MIEVFSILLVISLVVSNLVKYLNILGFLWGLVWVSVVIVI